ncbi:MAG: insulinase family protein [Alphaproteobacteria bacterium]|nr:insulinase family protein [Alphaproteobacteria bacterium]
MRGRKVAVSTTFLCTALLCLALGGAAQAASQVVRVVSPGGIEAWLVREPSIPFLAVQLAFRDAGAAADPAGREGLANMLGGLLDEGAGDLDSKAFQDRLSARSIGLRFDADRDRFQGGMDALSHDLEEAFGLLGLALTRPRFDAEPVARIRDQILTGLQRDAEDPGSLAHRRWAATAFPGHAYGRPREGTAETVTAIAAADLSAFARRRLARDRLVIGASGDVEPAAFGRLLDRAFGGLPARAEPLPLAETAPVAAAAVAIIPKAIPQSVVVFGQAGPKRNNPDFMAAFVMNHLLGGGGFSARLMNEIREKRGLVYGVSTGLNPLVKAGVLSGQLASQNARVAEAILLVRQEFRRFQSGEVEEAEVAAAKAYLTGSFPLQLDTNWRLARMLVTMQLQDLGIDYLERRNALVEAVSRDDVVRAARTWLRPDELRFVIVGAPVGVAATN